MKDKREIDRLIAEKVMGWQTQTFPNIGVTSAYTEDGELTIPEQFSPTKNLDQAWSVVEKFKLVKIERDSNRSNAPYLAVIPTETQVFTAIAETPQMAICIVALEACGTEVKQ
ncbi:hypothetical protein HUS59_17060 [Bacillus velezensis]|uniref:BC1872 family protein n=1 Tax=Bacillus velezensis TaxID=492670 RepID=UPI000C156DB8|nr:hypothetical protein [Bacillus velezensis]QHK05274.1 hypothetical protein C7M19_00203 [Bacillus velezensis]QHK10797.1 hypothetical protein C7M20_01921 [Bacillus velezensis]